MNSFFIRRTGALALTFAAAIPLAAQNPVPCDPTGNVSGTVGRAQFSMTRAITGVQSGDTSIRVMRDLQDVLRLLADDKTDNLVARDYLLGEAYVLLLARPSVSAVSPRSALGLTSNPTGTIDLFASADSAFTVVEQAKPECAILINQWRQQKPWLNMLNSAINALNAGQLDSAEVFAKRALLLDRRAPYAYSVLGSIAAQRKDLTTATDYWNKALAAASKDTLYNDVKVKTMFDVASAMTDRADAATGPDKRTLARDAIKAWQGYLAVAASDYLIADAIDRLERLYHAAGDSASVPTLYAAMLTDPSKYGELSLVHAGVVATRAGHTADAAKLFEATLATNPYARDALNNLAASYIQLEQYQKAFPLIDRLVALDPSNPDNVLLYAFGYQGLYKGTKDKKILKTYTDSLIYFNGRSENMPVKLAITEFSRGDNQTTLGGTIENRSPAEKTYVLSVDFLDKSGTVIATQDVTVGPVAPNRMCASGSPASCRPTTFPQKFRVTVPKRGVYGFRYKPLS
jgi:tetratricopeptide (TPR) repeat protein